MQALSHRGQIGLSATRPAENGTVIAAGGRWCDGALFEEPRHVRVAMGSSRKYRPRAPGPSQQEPALSESARAWVEQKCAGVSAASDPFKRAVEVELTPLQSGVVQALTLEGLAAGRYHFALRAEDEAGNLAPLGNSPGIDVN